MKNTEKKMKGNNHSMRYWTIALCLLAVFALMDRMQAEPETGYAARHAGTQGDEARERNFTLTAADSLAALRALPASFSNTQANLITRPEALRPVFDRMEREGRALRVLQLGDSHVAAKTFPYAVKAQMQEIWGKADSDSAACGVSFDYMARNGATIAKFLTAERLAAISERNPDLIILSFGTNECHGMGYREEVHRAELEAALEQLRAACPTAVFLLTTPPGDYLSVRRVTYRRQGKGRKRRRVVSYQSRPNPMSSRCAALIGQVAAEQQLPVWDLHTIAGGEEAVRNYVADQLMKADRIHFTPAGYELQGRLLGEAIVAAGCGEYKMPACADNISPQ